MAAVPFIELPGNGTLLFLRKLAPEGHAVIERQTGTATRDDSAGTVCAGTKPIIDFCHSLICILHDRQHIMHLHQAVNELLGLSELDWDETEFGVCETQCYLYGTKNRKGVEDGFLGDISSAHSVWFKAVALPNAWRQQLKIDSLPLAEIKKRKL